MAKIKKSSFKKLICSTCKGNGYIKLINDEDRESYIHQCWDCDSEGEFYETADNLIGDFDSDRNHDIKLH
jgi:DnaJ-class molecular chaperone|tara:strand:+ start:23 stop:232 length:210 start_codon:yes stop_codon:yes gene_type:complete